MYNASDGQTAEQAVSNAPRPATRLRHRPPVRQIDGEPPWRRKTSESQSTVSGPLRASQDVLITGACRSAGTATGPTAPTSTRPRRPARRRNCDGSRVAALTAVADGAD